MGDESDEKSFRYGDAICLGPLRSGALPVPRSGRAVGTARRSPALETAGGVRTPKAEEPDAAGGLPLCGVTTPFSTLSLPNEDPLSRLAFLLFEQNKNSSRPSAARAIAPPATDTPAICGVVRTGWEDGNADAVAVAVVELCGDAVEIVERAEGVKVPENKIEKFVWMGSGLLSVRMPVGVAEESSEAEVVVFEGFAVPEPSMRMVEGLAIEAESVLCVSIAALGTPEQMSYAVS